MIEVNTDPRLAPPTEEEIWEQKFSDFADEFNAGAQVFAEDIGLIGAAGARVFWTTAGPQVHSYDVLSMKRVDYELPLPTDVYPPFEVGADVIVTATRSSETWQISVYAVEEPSTLIDAITWPAEKDEPGLGQIPTPPISIDEGGVYLLNPEKVLHLWRPGMGAPEPLFSLVDRGIVLGKVYRFSVHGDNVLVLDEEAEVSKGGWGALWEVGLSGGAAQKVASPAIDVCFHAGSAIYRAWEQEESNVTLSALRYSSSDGSTENLTALVRGASVNVGGFPVDPERLQTMMLVDCQPGGFTFTNDLGLFFFDLEKREMQPLHLHRPLSADDELITGVFYMSKIVERVAFLQVSGCTGGDAADVCPPPVLYRRDLSAH